MDAEPSEAIGKNDTCKLLSLVQENQEILQQRSGDSFSTVLHLDCRCGHIEMVSEIVRLCPDMVTAENENLETPIHDACRHGNVKVLALLLDANPNALTLSSTSGSAYFVACTHGHHDIVNFLLNQPGIDEARFDHTCIHIAASRGHIDGVRELLIKWPALAQVVDQTGNSPLHHACEKGHREIAWILLLRDKNLALQYNNGYAPLHLAVMKGKVTILGDFASLSSSFLSLAREGETVFHLAVRFGHYDGLVLLVQLYNDTDIVDAKNNRIL